MKKFCICFFVFIGLILSMSSAMEVRLNWGTFNMPEDPVVVNDRILVPLRVIAEIFGCNVKWDESFVVTVTNKDSELILPIDSTKVTINGELYELDAPAILKNDTTMIPLRFISDYVDAEVEWHENSGIVNFIINNEELKQRAETVSRSYAKRTKYPNALNKKIVIDAGHGGTEVGATYGGIYEKDINLAIAKVVQQELEKQGVKVYMTRTTDATTTLASRANLANNINADLFVSVHNNAMPNKSSINGTEVLYPTSTIVKNGISAYSLATKLQETVSSLAGTYNKGIINRNNLYVLNHTKMPSVIVEVAYMTNYGDLAKLKDSAFLEKAGKSIAQGILESF